ncbi:expressed unknown protein [Seminavis robusta]|uniref:Uncharacterized protein n=1 Tax=Seminavis robusta TaxID=568900 RepID=A0A9N8EPJ0_9STRA|nr:expressed unknown protein [Seminavis robusta]|eukprot:Sro1494_g277340.1 n/a (142) ;mRNA; r:14026-14451
MEMKFAILIQGAAKVPEFHECRSWQALSALHEQTNQLGTILMSNVKYVSNNMMKFAEMRAKGQLPTTETAWRKLFHTEMKTAAKELFGGLFAYSHVVHLAASLGLYPPEFRHYATYSHPPPITKKEHSRSGRQLPEEWIVG